MSTGELGVLWGCSPGSCSCGWAGVRGPPSLSAPLPQAGAVCLRVPAARGRPEVRPDLSVRGEPGRHAMPRPRPPLPLGSRGGRWRPGCTRALLRVPADPMGEEHHAGGAPGVPAFLVVVGAGVGGAGGRGGGGVGGGGGHYVPSVARSVFWDLYCAAPDRREACEHTGEAKGFQDYVSALGVPPTPLPWQHVRVPVPAPRSPPTAGLPGALGVSRKRCRHDNAGGPWRLLGG